MVEYVGKRVQANVMEKDYILTGFACFEIRDDIVTGIFFEHEYVGATRAVKFIVAGPAVDAVFASTA